MNREHKHTTPADGAQMNYLRGSILKLVYSNFRDQAPHMDGVVLFGVMERLRMPGPLNDWTTALQQLRDRGYLTFEQERNKWTGRVRIHRISITPKGCDLVEGNLRDKEGSKIEDPAVPID
ncbi:MAG TPA: hypothetical protein VN577_20050 [Terriglobales bacterium]|nr:hypothetical protein [Clostridia bacterium]HWR17133.1 hypothetical protein [Terriglobales bacterium]